MNQTSAKPRTDPNTRFVAMLVVVIGTLLTVLKRWVSDDGFIYARVVEQIAAGNGPVFNTFERVEAATSPLWTWMLALPAWFGVPIEWAMVVLGIFCTVGALLVAIRAGRALDPGHSGIALLVLVLVPQFADFGTAGLEMGMAYLWIAASALLVTTRPADTFTAFVIGLGPLIRPDLAVIALVLLGWMAIELERPRARAVMRLAIAAAALPALYQIFRMGYFRAVVPNTAIAKSATDAYWSQGIRYLVDVMLVPSALLLVGLGLYWLFRWDRTRGVEFVLALAGALYLLLVVRGGGDFMRMRLALPSLVLFAILPVPWKATRSRLAVWVVLILGLSSLLLSRGALRTEDGLLMVVDERQFYVNATNDRAPVSVSAHASGPQYETALATTRASSSPGTQLVVGLPTAPPVEVMDLDLRFDVVTTSNIGVPGFVAPLDLYVQDRLGLADPFVARMTFDERGRPGHEKAAPLEWAMARFISPTETFGSPQMLGSARDALADPDLRRHLDGIQRELTPDLFFQNMANAIAFSLFEVEYDGPQAFGVGAGPE